MSSKNFAHLHVHTTYSLLDGISKRDELIKLTKEYGMPGMAVTEHGNLFNCVSFYRDAVSAGIVPIIGYEAYVAPDSRHNRTYAKKGEALEDAKNGDLTLYAYHLTILSKNRQGYENLKQLSTLAYKEGFYRKPRIDDELLDKHKDGLIVLSGCLAGKIARLVLAGNKAAAITEIDKLRFRHGENFYLELMAHNQEEETLLREALLDISKTHGIPTVLTGDSHFTHHGDELAHTVALNMGSDKTLSSPDKWTFNGDGYWYKKPSEMWKIAEDNDIPDESLSNTVNIVKSIDDYGFKLASKSKKFVVPLFREEDHIYTDDECHQLLEYKSWQGLAERGLSDSEIHRARIMEELAMMRLKNFSSYFLIISDIIDFMRRENIIVPIGRGSSLGSLVCYSLFITGLDPIEHGIPFERFINEGRKDLPDVDTDISKENRGKVLQYIAKKYGIDRVAHIVTFQSLRPKAALDNVGRVLDVPAAIRRQATADIHDDPTSADTLIDLIEHTPSAKQIVESVPDWLDIATRLEGNNRNLGSHAAGIVISNDSLIDSGVPLLKDADDGIATTQLDMDDIAELGLLKLDMLGLKTMDVMASTIKQVKDRYGIDIDWHRIPLNDAQTYATITSGRYVSIFQYDSPGMRNLAKQLQPDNFDHLVAINCLYRPGPMKKPKDGGQSILEMYLDRRHGRAPIEYWHPELEPVFKNTLGLCLFQESLMGLAQVISGFNKVEADEYRAAVGKKDREKFIAAQDKLIQRGIECGRDPKFMKDLADKVSGFARYGWNIGHSKAYSYISYVTAWLETHYPHEYYVSLLNTADDDSKKLAVLVASILQKNIKLETPNINKSIAEFSTDGTKIYMGLHSINKIGEIAVSTIIADRTTNGEYRDFMDFMIRMRDNSKFCNRTVKENLVKAGAFNWDTSLTLKDKISNIEKIQDCLKKYHDKLGLEETIKKIEEKTLFTKVEFSQSQLLEMEKSVLNFYISSHPALHFCTVFSLFPNANFILPSQLNDQTPGDVVLMAGVVTAKNNKTTQAGSPYLELTVSDNAVNIKLRIWSPYGPQISPQISTGQMVIVVGSATPDKFIPTEMSIKTNKIVPIAPNTGMPINAIVARQEYEINSAALVLGSEVGAIKPINNGYIGMLKYKAYIKPENVSSLHDLNLSYILDL